MPLTFWTTEFFSYAVAALFFYHAARRRLLGVLVTAIAYGFLLEFHTVKTETAYCYGRFFVMLPPWPSPAEPTCLVGARVPLWGSIVWGYFIYGAMATSSRLKMPWAVRPLLDGLLVLTYDWTLDPIAEKLGFWTWDTRGSWFGIPLDNFFGWFMVVASFSFALRWLQRKWPLHSRGAGLDTFVFCLAIVVSLVLLAGSLELYVHLAGRGVSQELLLWGTLGIALAITLPYFIPARGDHKPAVVFLATVLAHHLYNGILLVYSGLWREEPLLNVVWATAMTLAMIGYGWPYARLSKGDGRSSHRAMEEQGR